MATIIRTTDREREALRRAALAADQGPNDEAQANVYPRQSQLELLGDPQDPTNVTFPFLRRMRRDHMVAMGLHFISMPIVKAPFYYEADDARAAAFADNLIRPIYGKLVLTILRMLWAGYSPAAKNFEVVNPAWRYLDEQGNIKRVWDEGPVGAVVYRPVTQLKPENALPAFKNGRFNGITYDGRYGGNGYFIIDGQRKPDIDLLHSMWAAHDVESEDGSPFGFARIAHCAPIFHMYRFVWTLLGRAMENNADPGPIVRYPQDDPGFRDTDGKTVTNVSTALKIGRRRRSGSTIAMPSDVYVDFQDKPTGVKKWDLEYPTVNTSFAEIQEFLGFLESAKLRALWVQEQGLIEGSGGQSNRNVASEFGDKRDESQVVLMGQIDEVIDEQFVKPAMAMNMPWYEGKLVKKSLGFGSADDQIVQQVIQLAGQAQSKGTLATFGVDVRRLLESRGFPMLDHAAQQKLLDEAAKEASKTPTPVVTPTQGRRALVTQTGFNETMYQQIPDAIVLSEDGDFVAALPSTDVFGDKQVLASTRDLRTASAGFLSWAYADFARYVGKQKSLDLAAELEALADEDLLVGTDKVTRVVNKVIDGWRPKAEKLTDYRKRAQSVFQRVFDRTTGIQLEKVGSSVKLNSTDKAAAAWLDARGAELVTGILETTRAQLAEVLADGVREGKSTSEVAKDIRAHFDGFPATRAAAIARTEIGEAYNYATARAGIAAGLAKAQLIDGNQDKPCKDRNGKIVDLADALKQRLNHTNCTFYIRLLAKATAAFEVRYERLDGLHARYDADTETVLFSPDIAAHDEAAYLLAIGDLLAV
jgi:hypothetical protein